MISLESCLNCESHSEKKNLFKILHLFLYNGVKQIVFVYVPFFFALLMFMLFMVHDGGVVYIRTYIQQPCGGSGAAAKTEDQSIQTVWWLFVKSSIQLWWGSPGVIAVAHEQASCNWKVAGSNPLVCTQYLQSW